jgi:FkbM family methyltransferase
MHGSTGKEDKDKQKRTKKRNKSQITLRGSKKLKEKFPSPRVTTKDIGAMDPLTGKKLKFRYRPGTSDDKAYTEIFTKGVYRKKKLDFDVSSGETWIDLGGHIGLFTLYAISKGAARVYVYEADVENFAMLETNIKLNGLEDRVKCIRAAVVADTELGNRRTIDLWSSSNPAVNYRNSIVPKARGMKKTVPARKFNAVITKHRNADGIKIDIEGAEVSILTSNVSDYGNLRKMTFEFTLSSGRLAEVQRVLRAKGFKVIIPPSTLKEHAGAWIDYVVHATRDIKLKK